MHHITWKVLIRFAEIIHLRNDLRAEESIDAIVGRPKRQSNNVNEIVRIVVKSQITGPAPEEMVEKTILRYAESITGKDEIGKSSLEKLSNFFRRIGFVTVSSYAAIIGGIIIYDPSIFETHLSTLITTAFVTVPVSIGIGAAGLLKL